MSEDESDSDDGMAVGPAPPPRTRSSKPMTNGTPAKGGSSFLTHPRRRTDFTAPPLEDFRTAIAQGSLADVKILVNQGISVNQLLKNNWPALLCACAASTPAVVQYLIDQGADVNTHKDLYTPLMAVCCSTHYSEEDAETVVKALLAAGASASAADRHRCTPLIYAAKEGRSRVVRLLVAAGAETGKQDTMGWTAMMHAASRGYGHIVRHLVEAGADSATYNLSGQTAADLALANGFHAYFCLCGSVFGELEMVLSGLELQHLIPLFHAHNVSFVTFLRFTDDDLDRMKIEKVGERRKILDGIREIHQREWERSSLPTLHYNKYLTCPDAVGLMMNVSRHIRLIHASVGYLRDQIQARPRILELGQDTAGVTSLADTTAETSRHLRGLYQELKFLSLHLKK
ncbi:Ankyrin repeat, SAM and basic leucine zipper domain-containing protein 1 [Amphibalanus amphitrite]|uniref:Ankyrin repeat, SAM and basic leucine zipper domain-containing protein 1 n=1 Tax=Amphibalanus amphitrite TaxID=1232801 RepID=A0A6A4W8U6_AMPAM|nr:Ankyrin repeat, SAM and basic leucine zipper domain-containing protein 1 [Amphibalanus amphitrite]